VFSAEDAGGEDGDLRTVEAEMSTTTGRDDSATDNAALYRKISVRVATPLILLYLVAFLDRVNIGFAALSMNHDLGLSESVFGLASGIFFLGYMLFAVPSNVMLTRFGPRRWMTVLMVTWGLLSGSMAFVHGPRAYVALRFLIGAAEAGFFPGIVLYLTRWLPSSARAGILSLFMLSIPLSSIVGSPISARIMQLNGAGGLAGWQWLFLLEAVPAVLLGCTLSWILSAGPKEAAWLSDAERAALADAMAEDDAQAAGKTAAARAALPVAVLALAAATYFLYTTGLYELSFWVPRLLFSAGVPLTRLGWLTAIPFVAGAVSMFQWSRWSDRSGERRLNLAGAFLAGACGLGMTAAAHSAPLMLVGLCVSGAGIFAALPLFWAAFSQRVTVAQAAVSIALVNSLGNVGGFAGPFASGWLLERTHGYVTGLLATAFCLLLGAALALAARSSAVT
jgi:ACS family tartrate transporter-like MFS transporter